MSMAWSLTGSRRSDKPCPRRAQHFGYNYRRKRSGAQSATLGLDNCFAKACMSDYPEDIYTEPSNQDGDTLKNLGPLTRMAGVWEGARGLDVKPKPEGPKRQAFVERIELQPIDPMTNGPPSDSQE